jgi:hypothetical protein
VNRPMLPFSAVCGPTEVECELCGQVGDGMEFYKGGRPAGTDDEISQHPALDLCASCLQDAAGEFPMHLPLLTPKQLARLSTPPLVGDPTRPRPETPARGKRGSKRKPARLARKGGRTR